MADASGAPTMPSELVSCGAMTTAQTSKEKVIRKEHPQQNIEEEYDPEDQLTLSQLFMNKAGPSASPSLVTPLDSVTPPTSKRSKLMIKERHPKKSPAESSPVMEKAKALQAGMDPKHPSFIKFLTRSHVTQGFWMGLPQDFCRMHLPNYDLTIKLEGDNGVQYDTKFLASRGGLSGGWRGFSLAHNLQEGDAVVFHFVRQLEFKVYIVRKSSLDHHAHERQLEIAMKDVNTWQDENKLLELAALCELDGQPETHGVLEGDSGKDVKTCQDENKLLELAALCEIDGVYGKEDLPAKTMMDWSSPRSTLNNFSIEVNGCVLGSEMIPDSTRVKYYELCCARKSCLHLQLLKNINNMFAAGIILETVSIADEIQACSVSTFQTDLKKWDKALKAIKGLGMEVGFLQERIRELSRVAANRHSNLQEYSSTFQQIAKSPW